MRRIIIIIMLFCFSQNLISQDQMIIDSLLNKLESNISETKTVDIYNELAHQYHKSDTIKATFYIEKAIEIAKRIDYKEGSIDALLEKAYLYKFSGNLQGAENLFTELSQKAKSIGYKKLEGRGYFNIAVLFKDRSNYSTSIEYYLKAVPIFEELKDTSTFLTIYSYIAGLSLYQDNYPVALEYYLKSLKIFIETNNDPGIAACYNNMGIIHKKCNEFTEALDDFEKALDIYERLNANQRIADAQNNIGTIYQERGDYFNAIGYYEKSLKTRLAINDELGIAKSYNNIGEVQGELGNQTEALDNYLKALKLNKTLNNKMGIAHSSIGIGMNYFKQNEFAKAKIYLLDGFALAKEIEVQDLMMYGANFLSKTENALGNYKNAYDYHVLYNDIGDSIQNDNMTRKLAILETNFKFVQKIDSINFANQTEQQITYQKLANKQRILLLAVLAFIIVLVFSIVLYRKNQAIILNNAQLSQANVLIQEHAYELERLNKTKSRFFAIIAHDIRNPMGVFLGFFELLKDHLNAHYSQTEDNIMEKFVTHLKTANDQLLNLLDGLLNWALKEENVIPYQPTAINLKNCIEKTMESHLFLANAKLILLISDLKEDFTIWADKNSIMTILRNLTGNAIKFSNSGGSVLYKVANKENFLELKIIDQGVGIPAEKLDYIFEIEENKTTQGTKGEKGTGLGLNIVHDFVKMNNGTITVQSEINVGTTFTILLPINSPYISKSKI